MVMFVIPRVNVVESDEGYSVEIRGRNGVRYVEGSKYLDIDAELATGPSALIVYPGSIKRWSTPGGGEIIDEDHQQRIVENVKAALRFKGIDIDLL